MANKATSTIFNIDWETADDPKVEKSKEYLEFNTPPLALVLAMLEAGKEPYEIGTTLVGVDRNNIDLKTVVQTAHQEQAATIYGYFAKKHTMRRLKGEHISKYMTDLDELCENRKRIDIESVPILVSLPRIYEQNRAVEAILKQHQSAPNIPNVTHTAFDSEVEFVDSVRLKYRRSDTTHYFFKTPRNRLLRVIVKTNDYGKNAWDFVAHQGKIKIRSEYAYVQPVQGYDFKVFQVGTNELEILKVEE